MTDKKEDSGNLRFCPVSPRSLQADTIAQTAEWLEERDRRRQNPSDPDSALVILNA